MDAQGNGITISKSQVSFWATVAVGAVSIAATYFGASRPVQPEASSQNQQQILVNQTSVLNKLDDILANQKSVKQELDALKKEPKK